MLQQKRRIMETKRTATNYALTRKQKRYVAKQNMLKEGRKNICKHSYVTRVVGNCEIQEKIPSFFAENWKEYAEKGWNE